MRYTFLNIIIFLLIGTTYSQTSSNVLRGIVKDNENLPISGAHVFIKEVNKYVYTDIKGHFSIDKLKPRKYNLECSGIGYSTSRTIVTIPSLLEKRMEIILTDEIINFDEIVISGKSNSTKVTESSLSVKAVNINEFKSTKTEISQVLKGISGVRIRQNGGLGSDYSFALNGLSDYRVRFFIDEMPIDYLGEAYKLNNIPINFIDQVHIYKGVSPISLGADALGGSVHIITQKSRNSFVDASYSYESFNTHRVSINAQYRNKKTGFTFRPKIFHNRSDNNYTMYDREVYDYESKIWTSVNATRFHDNYKLTSGVIEAGYTFSNWADEFMFTHSKTQVKDDQQTDIYGNPLGEVRIEENENVSSLKFSRSDLLDNKLKLKLFAVYNNRDRITVDTTSNRYNWLGNVIRITNDNTGEISTEKTLFEYVQKSFIYRVNLKYNLAKHHTLETNYIGLNVNRKGENRRKIADDEPFKSPNTLKKQVIGVAYEGHYLNERLNVSAATKFYSFNIFARNSKYLSSNNTTVIEDLKTDLNKFGYSFGARYFFTPIFYFKTSFELGYRLFEPEEIFGNGISIDANPELKPETSKNINFGLHFNPHFGNHKIKSELNIFQRDVENYTQKIPFAKRSKFINIRDVLIYGIELDITYLWNQRLFIDANFTRQYVLNNVPLNKKSNRNSAYKKQLPNTPFLFSNFTATYKLIEKPKRYNLSINYGLNYVHEFFLGYAFSATAFEKNVIPEQITNDFGLTTSDISKTYSFSLQVTNIFNKRVYDNFNIQKPGRAIFAIIKYNINN